MTEVSGATHLAPRDPAHNKPGEIGRLIGSAEARVVSTETGTTQRPASPANLVRARSS